MCYNSGCSNLHCFECPAVALFRKGNMSDKLYQTCKLRSIEKELFDFEYDNFSLLGAKYDKKYWERRFSYLDGWIIDYSLPDLDYI